MKIGVLADTHDNVPAVHRAIEVFTREEVALVLHAGDFVAPFAVAPFAALRCGLVAVLGNNDGEKIALARTFAELGARLEPNLAVVETGGRKIAMTHYPEIAEPLARGTEFDLVVYGHTHEIDDRRLASRLLNPGEGGGWLTGRSTAALVDLESLEAEIVEIGGG